MKTKGWSWILIGLVAAAFVLGATGVWQLAEDAESETSQHDRLIGVLITRDYLDLFDEVRWLEDHGDALLSSQAIPEADSAQYEGKLYATLVDDPFTDEASGETGTRKEYVFEGIEGLAIFVPLITDQQGTYRSISGDEAITDSSIHLEETDEGERIFIEGTVYLSTRGGGGEFFLNPVYQSEAGEVFAVSGSGVSFGGEAVAGAAWSQELKEEQSITAGETSTVSGSEVRITLCYMDPPERVAILQFGPEDVLLAREEYAPDSVPERLKPREGVRYIIVETTAAAPDGEATVTRTLYQPEDESLSVFTTRADGICAQMPCTIDWNR